MITIRAEQPSDYSAIYHVTQTAFKDRPYADGDEHELITHLRNRGALSVSLVAVHNHQVVGQITFSPATLQNGEGLWFALGPVSVTPERQHQGIGTQLIETGLNAVAALQAYGCILTGDPRYYQRFGFQMSPSTCPEEEDPAYFMVKLLRGPTLPHGRFRFHPAFYHSNSAKND